MIVRNNSSFQSLKDRNSSTKLTTLFENQHHNDSAKISLEINQQLSSNSTECFRQMKDEIDGFLDYDVDLEGNFSQPQY